MAELVPLILVHLFSGIQGLLEGDLAVPRTLGGQTQDSFTTNQNNLWSEGLVPFLFETLELGDGWEEPIFRERDIELMRKAMKHISDRVPCIRFL